MKRAASALALLSAASLAFAAAPEDAVQRQNAQKLSKDGNHKEAYEVFRALALKPDADPILVGVDLQQAVSCLQSLNRANETEALREGVVAVHAKNWRLLATAARSVFEDQHWGYLIAGEFQRGHHRGGGTYASSEERDRVRALQLYARALELAATETDKARAADLCLDFARTLMGYRGYDEAWRLQALTDLAVLPDHEEGHGGRYRGDSGARGAPVDADGNPVYHRLPKSFAAAASDGERWRWLLMQAMELNPGLSGSVRLDFANFLRQQFGVQTMAYYGRAFGGDDDTGKDESGPYAVQTLKDDETIARLATGVKRFALPAEFDFIKLYRQIAGEHKGSPAESAMETLAQTFEDRRQYDAAAGWWKRLIEAYGAGHNSYRSKRLDQILGNWGQFEPTMTHPAGGEASIEFRFRNGKQVAFEARRIDVRKLLDDLKAYLKSNPGQLDWNRLQLENIGYQLVQGDAAKYVGEKAAGWAQALEPRPAHFDRRITVKTPLREPGAYLLTARMDGGNTCQVIVWIDDTAIVRKNLDSQALFFAADAATGKPLPNLNLEFFGYRQQWRSDSRKTTVETRNFAALTDASGLAMPTQKDFDQQFQWLVIATSPEGRLAYLGFSNIWYGRYYDREYNATKAFMITDRPVYRPNQPVRFKFWASTAKYDQDNTSRFAGQSFVVRLHNPKNEKVLEKAFTSDAYGGLDGEYLLPNGAALGVWRLSLAQPNASDPASGKQIGELNLGGGTFRVEEYKKPEFEVTVEAPTEPVALGEKVTAKVQAKYYFGAPVAQGRVKYKILRSDYRADWYPMGRWDWFYGKGYWWFACDYAWYPGWREWGCFRPTPWWWSASRTPPEVVAEAEVDIGKDGTLKVEIDSALAKAMHGDTDHRYEITAEVTDESRRTIVGQGTVLVARKPFKVYAWVDRGHYRVGDVVQADFSARTLDGKPVAGKGELVLYRIAYEKDQPKETAVQEWNLATDAEGAARQQLKASAAGQYRLAFRVTDAAGHRIEGGYVFSVMGEGADGKQFRFNELELVTDRREYQPGDKVKLRVNADQADATVLLFLRPANGFYLKPEVVTLKGKSLERELDVTKKDMPNFFVEALTVHGGKVYTEMREVVVPPEKRVLNVDVLPSARTYKPGEMATVKVRLTDFYGEPFKGSTVMTVYDKAVEYVSGGSNVGAIRDFFWKWRRHHNPSTTSSLDRRFANLTPAKVAAMQALGVFGDLIADESDSELDGGPGGGVALRRSAVRSEMGFGTGRDMLAKAAAAPAAASAAMADGAVMMDAVAGDDKRGNRNARAKLSEAESAEPPAAEATVRTQFADTAFWVAALTTDEKGLAEVSFKMPENLTGWKVKTWALGTGAVVGEGVADVVTAKRVLLRLQAPRFFVEKDDVVLSANIHNYLDKPAAVRAVLELDGGSLALQGDATQKLTIDAGGEKRVDWRVKVAREGEAVVRMKALAEAESDAMEMRFPAYVHGMLKTESFCGVLRRGQEAASIAFSVPAERRPEQSRLEVRYSPTLAGAMVDALPYLAEYPYGCTEQTLNRFLPSVITRQTLRHMGVNLKQVQEKRTNLNAQEIGDDKERAKQWKRWDRNPVFDEDTLDEIVRDGVQRLTAMQLGDGGWGWFSGWGERSDAHTTAWVVRGLQTARTNGVALVPGTLERGVKWLQNHQAEETRRIRNAERKVEPWKPHADSLDALVYLVLADAGVEEPDMREFLYRDRNDLSVYAKAAFGLGLHRRGQTEKRDMLLRNIEQFLVEDKENQTAWLNLGNEGYWWCWYGSEYEAHAFYLKLLAAVDPKSDRAAGLVKYLLNNRKHATYWNSTRDTALCVEALADFLRASGEDKPDMTVELVLDGQKLKEEKITADNLFTFDNKLVIEGKGVTTGKHSLTIRRQGSGPVYANAYLSNFTLEDFIAKAGLEVRVERRYYRLVRVDATAKVAGARGQALDQKVEKYERKPLKHLDALKSGDLVEVELEIASKNDYEYIVFEDLKPAGFEPVEVRSGYTTRGLSSYVEYRDERVCFFVRTLARGTHSVSYRMRAGYPGVFSALPTRAYAMYAPELKANSDEIRLKVED